MDWQDGFGLCGEGRIALEMGKNEDKPLILLIEDNQATREMNREVLLAEGYLVLEADSLAKAREILNGQTPDLILLDMILPDGSGLDFCRSIRAQTIAPILFLTVRSQSELIVGALKAGGDDYIVKPYEMPELLARIAAQLRRLNMLRQEEQGEICLGPLALDFIAQRVTLGGEDLLLSPREFALLGVLACERGRFLTATELYTRAWKLDAIADLRTVKVHLSTLRRKLRLKEPSSLRIEYMPNHGYRLDIGEGDEI